MKKILNVLLYLPMPIIGIYYGVWFSIPGDSDTIPLMSMLTGIILVALPMLLLSILNIAMFIINIKCNNINKRIIIHTLIGGMMTPAIAFLWLLIMSNFNLYFVTGVYAFVSFILGIILLILTNKDN